MGVSENSGTPKSSILIGFSIINHPLWGTPLFLETSIYSVHYIYLDILKNFQFGSSMRLPSSVKKTRRQGKAEPPVDATAFMTWGEGPPVDGSFEIRRSRLTRLSSWLVEKIPFVGFIHPFKSNINPANSPVEVGSIFVVWDFWVIKSIPSRMVILRRSFPFVNGRLWFEDSLAKIKTQKPVYMGSS